MDNGSPLFMLALLGVMILVLIVLPARRAKKAQAQLKERHNQMAPGTPVMTNFGLYGTVVSIDKEANTAQLEIAPGTVAKVHLMTVTQIEDGGATANGSTAADSERQPTINGEIAGEPQK